MSTYAAALINAVPDIDKKRYLELGVEGGKTFNAVNAGNKLGVDINVSPNIAAWVNKCTTDKFFEELDAVPGYPTTLWSTIFIDAGHEYEQVLRDFNNALRYIQPDGFIFIHDLVPPDESYTTPVWCGDGFKLLQQLTVRGVKMATLNCDYGLTVVRPWSISELHPKLEPIYSDLQFSDFNPPDGLTVDEMIAWIKKDEK